MPREIRVALPVDDADGERRGRGRSEDQRHVDDRGGEGKHGEDRKPELPVERRQHRVHETDHPPVAERRDHALHLRSARLRQHRKRHQKKKRYLLDDEAEDHGEAVPVLHDEEIRRPIEAEYPGRDAEEEPGRRDQEGEPEGGGRVRHAQER